MYLFLERGEGSEKDRERDFDVREKLPWVASPVQPSWGLNPQPGMCPDRGMKPATLCFAEQSPTNRAIQIKSIILIQK